MYQCQYNGYNSIMKQVQQIRNVLSCSCKKCEFKRDFCLGSL